MLAHTVRGRLGVSTGTHRRGAWTGDCTQGTHRGFILQTQCGCDPKAHHSGSRGPIVQDRFLGRGRGGRWQRCSRLSSGLRGEVRGARWCNKPPKSACAVYSGHVRHTSPRKVTGRRADVRTLSTKVSALSCRSQLRHTKSPPERDRDRDVDGPAQVCKHKFQSFPPRHHVSLRLPPRCLLCPQISVEVVKAATCHGCSAGTRVPTTR